MKTAEVDTLIKSYHKWLQEKTKLKEINGWVEVTTPFLDQDNDYIQIYINKDESGYILTDDGYAISELDLMGCEVKKGRRRELLEFVLKGYGVELQPNNALQIRSTEFSFPIQKHNLIQAILAILDLFYTTRSNVKSIFLEEVEDWLKSNEIRYIQNVRFSGKTGYDFYFHFAIPASQKSPERILQALTRPDSIHTKNLILSWMDTRDIRPKGSQAYVLLNDLDSSEYGQEIDALKSYNIKAALWTERDKIKEELAA